MADYYPLIAKAVAGLDKSTGEARRALYERARTALVTQLRGVVPALSESEITRERLALEEAIRKVEAEAARKARFDPPPERKRADRGDGADAFKAPQPPRPAAPRSDDSSDEPAAESSLSGTAADLRRRNPAPPERPSLSGNGLQGFRNVVADVENLGDATAQAGRAAREAYNQMPSPSPEFDRLEPRLEPEGLRSRDRRPSREQRRDALREATREASPLAPATSRTPAPPPSPRDAYAREPSRAPRDPASRERSERATARPPVPPRPSGRNGAGRGTADHDLPPHSEPMRADEFSANDFANDFDAARRAPDPDFDFESVPRARAGRRAGPAAPAARAERERAGRTEGRSYGRLFVYLTVVVLLIVAGGGVAWQWKPIVGTMRGLVAKRTTPPASAPQPENPQTTSAKPFTDRIGSQNTASAQPTVPPRTDETAIVAQRVVLYEEDPADPQGKRFAGSAVWHFEGGQPGTQNADSVVRADIEIPERKMTVKWVLKRNNDKTLPASHTIEINFVLPPDFPHGGIKNIAGVIMKETEDKLGVPLAGYSVKVTEGYFLLGLTATESDQQRNIALLKDRPWFDIPIVYNDGRRAILAVEKGIPGDRVFKGAFAAWKQ
jgi:hypothetical protein